MSVRLQKNRGFGAAWAGPLRLRALDESKTGIRIMFSVSGPEEEIVTRTGGSDASVWTG